MLGLRAIAESPIAALPDAMRIAFFGFVTFSATESDDVFLYAATEHYISRLSDDPPGQPFRGTLEKLPNFDRSIISSDGFHGLTNAWGNVGLINSGGDYDDYVRDIAIDGREATFKAFDPTLPYDNGFEVAKLIATSLTIDEQMLTVGFRDKGSKLDVPTQPDTYEGIGGLEGGPELAGKRRNMGFGSPKNITPVLLIAAELLLEVNGGRSVQAITNVCDKMYPLSGPQNDYATTALLRAAAVTDGWYSTCLAEGRLRTGAKYERLTCNVEGDNSGGYVNTTGTIMRRIIDITECIDDPTEVDTVSFSNLEADQPAPIDYYLDENSTETVAETFDKLTKGIRGYCGFTRLGMLQVGKFKPPSGTPAASYTDLEIIAIDVERLPSAMDPPSQRQRVAYERNWTVINDPYAGAADIDAARVAWAAGPYKVASTSPAEASAILEDHLQAQDPAVREAYFALEADALADAEEALDLANSGYLLYRVKVKTHPFTLDICQTARLTSDARGVDLADGRLGRIASISDLPDDNTVELRVLA